MIERIVGAEASWTAGPAPQRSRAPSCISAPGWYHIFAPAGGVATGWQTILRFREPGNTPTTGPYQGAWVELENGEAWFVHFQHRGAYGRTFLHLEPVR